MMKRVMIACASLIVVMLVASYALAAQHGAGGQMQMGGQPGQPMPPMMGPGMPGPGMTWMAGIMVVSLLVGIGVLALVIVGLVAAVRWLWRGASPGGPEDRALAILRERYARGEIDREEFEARWRDLSTQ